MFKGLDQKNTATDAMDAADASEPVRGWQNGRLGPPSTRAGSPDDGSLQKLPEIMRIMFQIADLLVKPMLWNTSKLG